MFEGIIGGFIVFAVGYALATRVMGRRVDVLHGEFIHRTGSSQPTPAAAAWLATMQRYLHGIRVPARR